MSLHATAVTVYQCIDVHTHFVCARMCVRTSIPHDFRGAAAATVGDNTPRFLIDRSVSGARRRCHRCHMIVRPDVFLRAQTQREEEEEVEEEE